MAIVLLLVPAALSADLLDFSVGATGQYKIPVNANELEWQDSMGDIENYAFGADIRTRVLFAEVDVMALYGTDSTDSTPVFDGIVTGGLSLDLLGLVRVGVGLGPRVTARLPEGQDPVFIIGGTPVEGGSFEEAVMDSPLTWRATADLKLGNILVGLNYMVDSAGFTLNSSDYTTLLPGESQWSQGRVGASVLFTIF